LIVFIHVIVFRLRRLTGRHSVEQKARDWLAIAGFWKIQGIGLAVPSRDASAADLAIPHGRLSTGSLPAQANCMCLGHIQRR
jgi:hypothetical protein